MSIPLLISRAFLFFQKERDSAKGKRGGENGEDKLMNDRDGGRFIFEPEYAK